MNKKENVWKQVDLKALVPGSILMIAVFAIGALFPKEFETYLNGALAWIMDHFKWMYVLCVIAVVAFFLWILFSKYGNIRFGGKDARPSIKTGTWCTLTLTGTIAVGICFFGVTGPVNLFMNPPEFLGVEAGAPEAVIPTLEYCYLHYGLPPYFLITAAAMVLGLVYYNGKQKYKVGSTLYPLFGDKVNGLLGYVIDMITVITLVDCGTNMGLAVIQLNAGIGTVAGMSETPSFEPYIILAYTVATVIFATSGVHKLMGKLSNLNAACYVCIILFVLICSPANRLLGLLFSSVGKFVVDFIPMITFADPVYNTDWQNNWTMYYYSWNILPGILSAFFYSSIAYGRTLRQFIVVNCIVPCGVIFTWYVLFGGNAMLSILDGGNIYEQMQQFGDGIATFAFLDTLPLGSLMKWFFIIVAMMTFITFSDGIAYSFPMMFMKKTEVDASHTKTPKLLTGGLGILMGVMTFVLLYVGGYNALNAAITVAAFPCVILTLFIIGAGVKVLIQRKKYDIEFLEELEEEEKREALIEQHQEEKEIEKTGR